LLIEPPMTADPGPFSTGIDSPVIMLSSTADPPSVTSPSVAIFSPGRTRNRSLTLIISTGTSTSSPSWSTRAVLACSPMRARMACDVLPFAFASRYLPNRISEIIMAEVSK